MCGERIEFVPRLQQVTAKKDGSTSTLSCFGLWEAECKGLFENVLKQQPQRNFEYLLETSLMRHICRRAQLVNQNYIWPWRGTLSDLVALAALIKYDRAHLLTMLFSHDIPREHFQWFQYQSIRCHVCEHGDVLPFITLPMLSTYCGDIIFEPNKDCVQVPQEWLDGNDWSVIDGMTGVHARDLAALGFHSLGACGWWLRLNHTWRFNSQRLLGEIKLGGPLPDIHPWNQCPDFYDDSGIRNWASTYAAMEKSQMSLIANIRNSLAVLEMSALQPCKYYEPHLTGTVLLSGVEK